MKNLHYAGEFLTVDEEICTAVFAYASALANARRADVVNIPILFEGRRETSNLLLGPASLLFCTPAPATDTDVDLGDTELLAFLARRTEALAPAQGVAILPANTSAHAHDVGDYV